MGYKKYREMKVYGASIVVPRKRTFFAKEVYKTVPQIRLQGEWLAELGFEAGCQISVECQQGKLIIKYVDNGKEKESES